MSRRRAASHSQHRRPKKIASLAFTSLISDPTSLALLLLLFSSILNSEITISKQSRSRTIRCTSPRGPRIKMANLEVYRRYVNEIKQYAAENGISALETNKIFEQCFRTLEIKLPTKISVIDKFFNIVKMFKRILIAVIAIIFCIIVLYNHPTTHTIVLRNLQNYIYPGLKVFRKIAVPIVKRYPGLTEWYDEWCLVENPYFRVAEMDCWPCTSVRSIPDLTDCNISAPLNIGMPYTRKESFGSVGMKELAELYTKNQHIFDNDAWRISSNNASYRTIGDVFEKRMDFEPSQHHDNHVTWRIMRMKPGRLIRKLFPRPAIIPGSWSQSIEKFVLIDEPKAAVYPLPNPECSNVVMRCTSGSRLINMVPSSECQQSCHSFTILLRTQHTLWYNWWYWRPLSIPAVNSTEMSINYLTSFC